jgi:O-antigen biosynthesis protein
MNKTSLAQGNQAFRDKDYQAAIRHYRNAIAAQPELQKILQKNIELAQKRLGTSAPEASAPQGVAIDIVVPVYNALPDVQACLASLDRCRDGFDVRVIIVNDGSEAPTTDWLRSFAKGRHDVTLIEHASNAGYTRAVNAGLKASTAPFVITQNSDTIVTPGWLKGMVACMESDPRIGIVGPLSNAAGWQSVPKLRNEAGDFAVNRLPQDFEADRMGSLVAKVSLPRYPRLQLINGCCLMIRREVIEVVGHMDEESFPVGYGEETDYCIRAMNAGFHAVVADDTYVYHAKSKSFGHEKRNRLSEEGHQALKRKYGLDLLTTLKASAAQNQDLEVIRREVQDAIDALSFGEGKVPTNDSSDLELILQQRLVGKPKRWFKEFDRNLEARFLTSISKLKDSVFAARTRKTFVSVVMPTHNRAQSIGAAILSVTRQSHQKWELIIVDDGSTDSTSEVIKKFAQDTRIKAIQGDHRGVSAARNRGLLEARGDYIFYLDSDNTWATIYLEAMLLAFLVSGMKAGYSGIALVDHEGNIRGYRGEPFDRASCLESNYIDLNAFGHHRDLLKERGEFDERLRRMVDWDLILRYTKDQDVFYAPFVGCQYSDNKQDDTRITVKEPLAFRRIVQLKNTESVSSYDQLTRNLKLKFAIKIPAPFEQRLEWGDFHFADSLRVALEKLGHQVVLDFHGKWYERPASHDDVVIVIRGLTAYKTSPGPINILWNISHPDQVPFEEYESYDYAYVASDSYASFLSSFVRTSVRALLQCTDAERFFYSNSDRAKGDKILFVGNSRNEYRPIVKQAVDASLPLEVYGTRWEQFIPTTYIHGENIPNASLREYYAKYGAVLNDHWDSMRTYGFVSNRVFDVLAAGGELISDPVPSISRLFGKAVAQLADGQTLESTVSEILTNPRSSRERSELSQSVLDHHSFDARAAKIHETILNRLGLVELDLENTRNQSKDSWLRHNVGILLQNGPARATSSGYIRLIAPLTTEKAFQHIKLVILEDENDPRLAACSQLIVQRVAIESEDSARKIIAKTRELKIPLYIDIDDAFSRLPETHPEKDHYLRLDGVVRFLMREADCVWFSTKNLADLYRSDCRAQAVIPNRLDPRLWVNYRKRDRVPAFVPPYKLLYMGTATHDADFEAVLPALDALYEKAPGSFDLTVIGALRNPPQRKWLRILSLPKGFSKYPYFCRWLIGQNEYDIGLAPLVDNEFNECKSDIKFLDYSALGVPTVCSRVSAYKAVIDSGLVVSCENTKEDWTQTLSFVMKNRELMLGLAKRAKQYLWEHRSAESSSSELLKWFDGTNAKTMVQERVYLPSREAGKRIAVCLHLYYADQWPTISKHLKNIKPRFDLFVSCRADDEPMVQELVKKDFSFAVVVPVENKGMDVLPFLRINYEFSLWQYDAVLKLHSKNQQSADGATLGKLCFDSLLGSPRLVDNILSLFLDSMKVGMLGPELLYRSSRKLMYGNESNVRGLLRCLELQWPDHDWGFFAGTMFWVRGSLLQKLAVHFSGLCRVATSEKEVNQTGGDGAWAHAMERVLGILPTLDLKDVAVAYPVSSAVGDIAVRQLNDGDLLRNSSYLNGSIAHLPRYANLSRWTDLCRKSPLFNSAYYREQAAALIPVSMDPAVHFVLYGDDFELNPSERFAVAFYKKRNPDVVKSRVSTLVHYILHGEKEGRKKAAVDK